MFNGKSSQTEWESESNGFGWRASWKMAIPNCHCCTRPRGAKNYFINTTTSHEKPGPFSLSTTLFLNLTCVQHKERERERKNRGCDVRHGTSQPHDERSQETKLKVHKRQGTNIGQENIRLQLLSFSSNLHHPSHIQGRNRHSEKVRSPWMMNDSC